MKTAAAAALTSVALAMCGCSSSVPQPAAASGYPSRLRVDVHGRLRMTGGPEGASQPGVSGTVSFVDRVTGDQHTATANARGSFTVVVAPGRYTVTGTSPRFMDGRGSCVATVPTVVPASGLTGVVVACSRR